MNDVQGYISNQILHVSWQEFRIALEHNVSVQVCCRFHFLCSLHRVLFLVNERMNETI